MEKMIAVALAVLAALAIGVSLESVNPHRKKDSMVTPLIAALCWLFLFVVFALFGVK